MKNASALVEPPDPYQEALRMLPDLREVGGKVQEKFPRIYEVERCDHERLVLSAVLAGEQGEYAVSLSHHLGQPLPPDELGCDLSRPEVPYYGTMLIFSRKGFTGSGSFEDFRERCLGCGDLPEESEEELFSNANYAVAQTEEPLKLVEALPDLLRRYSPVG